MGAKPKFSGFWGRRQGVKLTLVVAVFAFCATVMPAPHAAAVLPTPQADGQIVTLLRGRGIRPVQPPTPASDFRLPDLAGGTRALSESRGQWVVLTFFATWCGPCRSEMPTLEQLHRKLGDEGLVVLGVSTDRSEAKLPAFLDGLGITYPNLWDSTGATGRAYRATSIPLSYLIDPAGRIVGVSRGARDWSTLADLFERSFEIYPPGEGPSATDGGNHEEVADAAAATGRTTEPTAEPVPVELPTQLEPPTAQWALSTAEPRPGETFYLDIKILWAGNFDEYLLLPPALEAPQGLRQIGTSASTSSEAGRNVVSYRLAFEADEVGAYALDPIELRYTPRFEQEPVASRIAGPTVTVARATLLGMPVGLATATATGAAAALALFFTLLVRRQRRPAVDPTAGAARFPQLEEQFDLARRQRMQGDAGASLATLARLEAELSTSPSAEESAQLARWLDDVRYGGQLPPRELLDRIERRVEIGLQALRPDLQQAQRARFSPRLRSESDSRPGSSRAQRSLEPRNKFSPLALKESTPKDS